MLIDLLVLTDRLFGIAPANPWLHAVAKMFLYDAFEQGSTSLLRLATVKGLCAALTLLFIWARL